MNDKQLKDLKDNKNLRNYYYRKNKLMQLKTTIVKYVAEIEGALFLDLSKGQAEAYLTEVSQVIIELNYLIKNLKKFMKQTKVKTPLTLKFAKSYKVYESLGVVLIMSPWNYPFLLALNPLLGAISAGNTVVLKPSEFTPHTNLIITKIIKEVFLDNEVLIIEGGVNETTELLEHKFDYIFFTGSSNVAKIVMKAASKHLTPVTLELGGKSPVVLYDDVSIKLAAKKIAFGKTINAGQTCIAPDYLFIKEQVYEEFIKWFNYYVTEFFGKNPEENNDYPKIINEKNFNRLLNLIEGEELISGGVTKVLKISPTLIKVNDINIELMQEEIFGPILPIITFKEDTEPLTLINNKDKPLVSYIFTNNKKIKKMYEQETSSGTLVFNEVLTQFANLNLPFGGVGNSGMGKYHGKATFTTFSHEKSVMDKKRYLDLNVKYQPYTEKKKSIMKRFLK